MEAAASQRAVLITRHAAAMEGLRYYFTGRECLSGHVAPRYVSTGACQQCNREGARRQANGFKAMRRARAIGRPWVIVDGTPEQIDMVKALGVAVGFNVRDPTKPHMMVPKSVNWEPPQELVNPGLHQEEPVMLKEAGAMILDSTDPRQYWVGREGEQVTVPTMRPKE